MLEKLNLYGLSVVEDLLMVPLITGDPILIISHSGAAKTALIKRLGRALGVKAAVINCHTSDPQDWVGIPLPPKMGAEELTELVMIRTPQSISDAVLLGLDEISRVEVHNQSKLFSLIQDREVDGAKMAFRYLYAMMNPPSGSGGFVEYEGSEPLEFGLADRFALYVNMPAISDMDSDLTLKVARAATNRGIEHNEYRGESVITEGIDGNYIDERIAFEFRETIADIRGRFLELMEDENIFGTVLRYVTRFSKMMNEKKEYIPFDGRHIGMTVRAILALYASYDINGLGNLDKATERIVTHSYPNAALGKAYDPDPIKVVHAIASKEILSSKSVQVETIAAEPDLMKRVGMVIHSDSLGVMDSSRFVRDYLATATPTERLLASVRLFNPIGDLCDQQTVAELANMFTPLLEFDGRIELDGEMEGMDEFQDCLSEPGVDPLVKAVFAWAVSNNEHREENITMPTFYAKLGALDRKMKGLWHA